MKGYQVQGFQSWDLNFGWNQDASQFVVSYFFLFLTQELFINQIGQCFLLLFFFGLAIHPTVFLKHTHFLIHFFYVRWSLPHVIAFFSIAEYER